MSTTIYIRKGIDPETLALLEGHAKRLNRQIKRLDLDLAEVVVETIRSYAVTAKGTYGTVQLPRLDVEITAPDVAAIVKPGFELIALAQDAGEGDVQESEARIMTRLGDESVELAPFRAGYISCDECGTKRRRNTILVLLETVTSRVFGVGTDCAEKYLPAACYVVKVLEGLPYREELEGEGEGEDPFAEGGNGSCQVTYDLGELLKLASIWIRARGYARVDEPGETKGTLLQILHGKGEIAKELQSEYAELSREANAEEIAAEVAGVRAWVDAEPFGSDYTDNLKSSFASDTVTGRTFGLVISSVSVYRRHVERQREEAAAASAPDIYFGELNTRFGIVRKAKKWNELDKAARPVGEITGIQAVDGYYGTTYRTSIRLESGETLTWWASRDCGLEGRRVSITATVKKQERYRGKCQTTITRATLEACA